MLFEHERTSALIPEILKMCVTAEPLTGAVSNNMQQESSSLAAEESCVASVKVLDPILWSTLHFSTPLRPNHRRHTFTTAATVCLGCGLSLNVHSETYQRIGL